MAFGLTCLKPVCQADLLVADQSRGWRHFTIQIRRLRKPAATPAGDAAATADEPKQSRLTRTHEERVA